MAKKRISPWVIVAGGLLVILIVWFVFFRDKKPEYTGVDPVEKAPGGRPMPVSKALPKVGNDTLLKKGMKAQEVQWLQYLYNKEYIPKNGGTKLAEDGVFGAKTEAAVKRVTGTRTSIPWSAWRVLLNPDSVRATASPFITNK